MTRLKISTPEEWLAILPHQLGYRLEDCVAVVIVTDKVVGPIARVDLPDERHVRALADQLLTSLLRTGPQQAFLVGYESVPGDARPLLTRVHRGLSRAGVGIIDHVVVRDGRWWGWCCRPPNRLEGLLVDHVDGHRVPDDTQVPAVAEFIVRGSAPLASRHEFGNLVAEDPALSSGVGVALQALWDSTLESAGGEVRPGRSSAPDGAVDGESAVARASDLWARVFEQRDERGEGVRFSDDEVARLLRSLADKHWRDTLIAWMSPVMFPLDEVDSGADAELRQAVATGPVTTSDQSAAILRRLHGLARRVPDAWAGHAAAICTVVGCVAWGLGNGSAAGDAVTRALGVDPSYRLAAYLDTMIEHQVRPQHQWSEVAA